MHLSQSVYQHFFPLLWLNNLISSQNCQVRWSVSYHTGQISNPPKLNLTLRNPQDTEDMGAWHLRPSPFWLSHDCPVSSSLQTSLGSVPTILTHLSLVRGLSHAHRVISLQSWVMLPLCLYFSGLWLWNPISPSDFSLFSPSWRSLLQVYLVLR